MSTYLDRLVDLRRQYWRTEGDERRECVRAFRQLCIEAMVSVDDAVKATNAVIQSQERVAP